jgi:hypothetical protein
MHQKGNVRLGTYGRNVAFDFYRYDINWSIKSNHNLANQRRPAAAAAAAAA